MVMRSGAGLARLLLYGIFAAWELFMAAFELFLSYIAELAACKALASSPGFADADYSGAVRPYVVKRLNS